MRCYSQLIIKPMSKRSLNEIYVDNIKRLEEKKEENINKYILPLETKIEAEKEKLRQYFLKRGIKV